MALLSAAVPGAADDHCNTLLPGRSSSQTSERRPIDASDLAALRDIGGPDGSILGHPSPITISPDQTRMAFVLARADPARNAYCRALVVMEIAQGAVPKLIDRGGSFIQQTGAYRDLVAIVGYPRVVKPRWHPDGSQIAYLRRDDGVTQIWLADVDGAGGRPLTRLPTDVEAIAWTPNGDGLIFTTRPGRVAERKAIEREALRGFLYDKRIVPSTEAAPRPSASVPLETMTLRLASGEIIPASQAEKARLEAIAGESSPLAVAPDGRKAGTQRGASPLSPARLWAEDRAKTRITCRFDACSGGIIGLWWEERAHSLLFLRREGWARGTIALYRWHPADGAPDRLFETSGALDGCTPAGDQLICTLETPTRPRRVVSLDPDSGRISELFDPNPEFGHVDLGQVERLFWRNDLGFEVRGDLVLPPDYRPGTRLPLIVTQYFSNGFLRGGTGDEYPIHPFAVRGFAVLSLERPTLFASRFPELRTFEEVNAANARGWGERKSLLSAVETGIDILVERGIVDPNRIGLTGLSDGATTVDFALINGRPVAAASISTCCYGPWTTMSMVGIAYADRMRRLGYPPASSNDREFWSSIALSANAASIETPLLMQLADEEYLLALETFTALREQNKPVEMFVFPGEHHIKWQPAHRLAIYRRNLQWFDFWLRGIVPSDPEQAERWKELRRKVEHPVQLQAPTQASASTSRMSRR